MNTKKSILALAVLGALGSFSTASFAAEQSASVPGYTEALNEFVKDASLSASLLLDTRIQKNKGTGEGQEFYDALNHTDYNVAVAFKSGFTGDNGIGIDLTTVFAGTLDNKTGGCTEIAYCTGWDEQPNEDGTFKFTKAALKFQFGGVSGDMGYTDMGVGTLGNVWGTVPGTYRGAKIFASAGDFSFGYAFVDSHVAVWQKSVRDTPVSEEGGLNYNYIHSAEVTGNLGPIYTKLGLGYAKLKQGYANAWIQKDNGEWIEVNDDASTSLQLSLDYWGESFSLGYDVYAVNSKRDYNGLGAMHGLKFSMPLGGFTWNSELQYTHMQSALVQGADGFANRMVASTYSTNGGTFSLWWDAMSDYNQNQELAWFNKIGYSFDGGIWMNAGVVVATIGDDKAYMDSEFAVNGNIGYTVPNGNLKGTTVLFHATYLDRSENNLDAPGAEWYNQAQQDFRLQVILPYNFI